MGRRIVFLLPDNASLMRYIYLKLCISSPCQGLRVRPRVSLLVCFGLAACGGPAVWLALAATGLPAASLPAALTIAFGAPAHPIAQILAQPFGFRSSPSHPSSPASWLRAFLASAWSQPTVRVHSQPWPPCCFPDLEQSRRAGTVRFPSFPQLTSRLHPTAELSTSTNTCSSSALAVPDPGWGTGDRAVTQTALSCRKVNKPISTEK